MVGFGSSLRKARRSGWEGAYLDYETLKLLLSQIEAVYEEEGDRRSAAAATTVVHHDAENDTATRTSRRRNRQQQQQQQQKGWGDHQRSIYDYQEDLFLEDDSDAAYLSTDYDDGNSSNDEFGCDDDDYDDDEDEYVSGDDNDNRYYDDNQQSTDQLDVHGGKNSMISTTGTTFQHRRTNSIGETSVYTNEGTHCFALCIPCSNSPNKPGRARRNVSDNSQQQQHRGVVEHSDNDNINNALQFHKSSNSRKNRRGSGSDNTRFYLAAANSSAGQYDPTSSLTTTAKYGTISDNSTNDNTYWLSQYASIDVGNSNRKSGQRPFHPQYQQHELGPTLLNAPSLRSTALPPPSQSMSRRQQQETVSLLSRSLQSGDADSNYTRGVLNHQNGQHHTSMIQQQHRQQHSNINYNSNPETPSMSMQQPMSFASIYRTGIESSAPIPNSNAIYTPASKTMMGRLSMPLSNQISRQRRVEKRLRKRLLLRHNDATGFGGSRHRRVPRHIRIAHAKARSIMERFLGLLRAEVEKVMLFAQSRLGELADTAGSLRFPSLEDGYDNGNDASHLTPSGVKNDPRQKTSSKNSMIHRGNDLYRFADNGIHPSDSSSSDDGGKIGLFSWSDDASSNDGRNSSGGGTATASVGRMRSGSASQRGPSPTITRPSPYSEELTSTSYQSDRIGGILYDSNDGASNKGDPLYAVRRQLSQYAEIRKRRSVFQRNDQILGEDMLFLSAVEEADGYTAVGVELMHILKYISVNLIAVRKICRKHDRLLMNRMVGGYYHRVQSRGGLFDNRYYQDLVETPTLGGLIAKVAGEVHDAHPALIGQMNHFKLEGVYDNKIQKLANSRTIEVVSSCLALALSEYEITRSRAHALTNVNSKTDRSKFWSPAIYEFHNMKIVESMQTVSDAEPSPSTSSSVSITRLRYTVVSIFALREAARFKTDYYMTYLARSMLTFTGRKVVGDGLDGCSKDTLDFFVSYNPDVALLQDSYVLYEGIRRGQWMRRPMDEVMISALAVATTPLHFSKPIAVTLLSKEETRAVNALSVVPESKSVMIKRLIRGQFPRRLTGRRILAAEEVPKIALSINRVSCFLYLMTYFSSHSTTTTLVRAGGYTGAYAAIIIGAPNVSSILVTILHCWLETRESDILPYRYQVGTFRKLFLFSCLVGTIGNAVHAIAVDSNSVELAILGRFLIGFSFAEVLHRQLMSACMPSHFVTESARLMLFKVAGAATGLLLGSLTQILPTALYKVTSRSLQVSSWLLVLLWIIQLFRVLIHFQMPIDFKYPRKATAESNSFSIDLLSKRSHDGDSHSSSSDDHSPSMDLIQKAVESHCSSSGSIKALEKSRSSNSSLKVPETNQLLNGFKGPNTLTDADMIDEVSKKWDSGSRKKRRRIRPPPPTKSRFFAKLKRFLTKHIGLPISLVAICFVTFVSESLFTTTPLITERYFGWSGADASTFLGWLMALVLPISFICEIISRRYEERTVVKRSLLLVALSGVAMMNWSAMYKLGCNVYGLFTPHASATGVMTLPPSTMSLAGTPMFTPPPYDGKFGVLQYIFGSILLHISLVALEGSTLSLLSKISPLGSSRTVGMNVGSLVTIIGLVSKIVADGNIWFVDVSPRLIHTDIVNTILVPTIICALILHYYVKKHFFFLI